MLRFLFGLLILAVPAWAAERKFDFSQTKLNETPQGFRSTVAGEGKPGEWKVVLDEVPSAMPAFSTNAPAMAKQSVLAQLSKDPTDEHFPLLIFDDETYGDFTFTVRLKTVSGQAEQMAGVAFRIKDEKNYYYVRLSSLGNNIRFFKIVDGARSAPLGQDLPVPRGVWHELSIECKGNQILVRLNGQQAIPDMMDATFVKGKIGFWTKSDSVSYFTGARISYTVRESLADNLVKETLKKYSKLQSLKIFALPAGKDLPQVIASGLPADIGQAGGLEEKNCLQNGTRYTSSGAGHYSVMLPLRDRNGEIVAAVKVTMGKALLLTEGGALSSATTIVKFMEQRVVASHEPLQ
jgi:hypothetical protein